MEGTPRLAERGGSPFKPQTALLCQMPSGGVEAHLAKSQTKRSYKDIPLSDVGIRYR
jgi:hypothetical protein